MKNILPASTINGDVSAFETCTGVQSPKRGKYWFGEAQHPVPFDCLMGGKAIIDATRTKSEVNNSCMTETIKRSLVSVGCCGIVSRRAHRALVQGCKRNTRTHWLLSEGGLTITTSDKQPAPVTSRNTLRVPRINTNVFVIQTSCNDTDDTPIPYRLDGNS